MRPRSSALVLVIHFGEPVNNAKTNVRHTFNRQSHITQHTVAIQGMYCAYELNWRKIHIVSSLQPIFVISKLNWVIRRQLHLKNEILVRNWTQQSTRGIRLDSNRLEHKDNSDFVELPFTFAQSAEIHVIMVACNMRYNSHSTILLGRHLLMDIPSRSFDSHSMNNLRSIPLIRKNKSGNRKRNKHSATQLNWNLGWFCLLFLFESWFVRVEASYLCHSLCHSVCSIFHEYTLIILIHNLFCFCCCLLLYQKTTNNETLWAYSPFSGKCTPCTYTAVDKCKAIIFIDAIFSFSFH